MMIRNNPISSTYVQALVVFVVAFAAYANSLGNGFVFDDKHLIVENPWIKDVAHVPDILTSHISSYRQEGASNYYRPLMSLYYMADYYLFGLDARGFHLSYVLFHALVSVVLFLTVSTVIGIGGMGAVGGTGVSREKSDKGGSYALPFMAALLFAAHPVHTQPVAWNAVHEMSLTLFFLLALYFHVQRRHALAAICFFLSAMSKETAAAMPLVAFAFDCAFRSGSLFPIGRDKASYYARAYGPLVLAGLAYAALRTYALSGAVAPIKRHGELGAYEYLINVPPLFADYLYKLVVPINLSAAYVFHPILSVFTFKAVTSIIVTALFIGAMWLARRRRPDLFVCLALIAAPLLPVLYIPVMGVHVFAENYLYLPSVGFVAAAAVALSELASVPALGKAKGEAVALSVAVGVAGVYGAATIKRNPVWHDDLSLWSETVKRSPDSFLVRNSLGRAYYLGGMVDEAKREFIESIRLEPRLAYSHYNLGTLYMDEGDIINAIKELEEARSLAPRLPEVRSNLGLAYSKAALFELAVSEFKEALELKPARADSRSNLGLALYNLGRLGEAIGELEKAVETDPTLAEAHYNLGIAYGDAGRSEEAYREMGKAMEISGKFSGKFSGDFKEAPRQRP